MNISTPVSIYVNLFPETVNAELETRNERPESPASPRRRGAPVGNCNARVHGCRSPRLVEAWRRILKEQTNYGGLDREILLTLWQLALVNSRGATMRVALRLTARLGRLVRIKYSVHLDDLDAVENAVRRLAFDLPLTKELAAKLVETFQLWEGESKANNSSAGKVMEYHESRAQS